MSDSKMTVSKNAGGMPPTRRSGQGRKTRDDGRRWYIEATVHLTDGTLQIERVEQNTAPGRETMDRWAMRRLQHDAVDMIEVQPVDELTRDREAGYLRKSERPIEVIGLPGTKP